MSLIFILFLVVIPFDVGISFGIVTVKLVHLVFLFSFILPRKKVTRVVNKKLFKITLSILSLIFISSLYRVSLGYASFSSLTYLINFVVYLILSLNFYRFVLTRRVETLYMIGVYVVSIYAVLMILDSASALMGKSIFALILGTDEYKGGQLLSSEPNWVSMFLVGIFVLMIRLQTSFKLRFGLKKGSLYFSLFIGLISNMSRSALGHLLSLYPLLRKDTKFITSLVAIVMVTLITVGLIVRPDMLNLVSEDLYYDLVNINKNPRIYDMLFIFDALEERDALLYGIGFGDITPLTTEMSWREFYPVSNQMWLHLVGNFGIIGAGIIFILILNMVPYKNSFAALYLIFLLLVLQLHNAIFLPIPYVLIALLFGVEHVVSVRRILESQYINARKIISEQSDE